MKNSRITIAIMLFSMTALLFTKQKSASMGGSASTNMGSHTAEYFEDKYLGIASYVLASKSNELTSNEKMALQTFSELNMSKGQLSHFESALSKHDCFKLNNPNIVGNNLNEVPNIADKPNWFTLDCSQKNTKDIKKAQKKMKKKLKQLKKKFKNK
ncbi:MAG: hypothetical protein CMF91_02630 [Candidatus Marinimicrobia bacterium]|nr:hypothetical protein [Candidatus Neomarinimicrobiota bacterium]